MKIVHFVHSFLPETIGGTQLYVNKLAGFQADRGHEVHIITSCHPDLPKEESLDECHIHRINIRWKGPHQSFVTYEPIIEVWVRHMLEKIQPEVAHIHHWQNLTDNLARISGNLGIPAVATVQDFWLICPLLNCITTKGEFCRYRDCRKRCLPDERNFFPSLRKKTLKREVKSLYRILIPSQYFYDRFAEAFPEEKRRFQVAPNPTLFELSPDGRSGSDQPLSIAFWGVLRYEKGPHLILEALSRLTDQDTKKIRVMMLGASEDPQYEKDIKRKSRGLPVEFLGRYAPSELSALTIDLAIFPSLFFESHAFVLDEAIQLQVPVLAPEAGAFAERLKNGGGGFFKIGDASDLAKKLGQIINNPEILTTWRATLPSPNPDIRTYGEMILSLYRRAMRAQAPDLVYEDHLEHLLAMRIANVKAERVNEERLKVLKEMKVDFQNDISHKEQHIRDLEADLKNRLEDIGNKQSYIDEMEEIRKEQDEYIRNLEREREERERYVGELEKRFLNRIARAGNRFFITLRERFRK